MEGILDRYVRRPEKVRRRITPYLQEMFSDKRIKSALHYLKYSGKEDLVNLLYDFYTSLKHPHFDEKRCEKYLRQMRKILSRLRG